MFSLRIIFFFALVGISHAATLVNVLTRFETSTDGTLITPTILANGTVGTGGTWSMPGNANTTMTISTYGEKNIPGLFTGSGSSADGGTRGLRVDGALGEIWAEYTFSSRNKISLGFAFLMTNGYSGDSYVSADLLTALRGGGDTCVFNFYDSPWGDAGAGFSMETGGGSTSNIKMTNDTWYWVTIQYDGAGGTSTFNAYTITADDPSLWPLFGSVSKGNSSDSGTYMRIGRYDNHGNASSAKFFFDDLCIDLTGNQFPLLPGANPIIPLNRRVTWAGNVGIPGGIPTNYTVWCSNITVSIPGTNIVAAGNGVADDTTAINTALDRCPNGQIVLMPAGTYLVSSLVTANKKGVILRGAGTNTVVNGNFFIGASGTLDVNPKITQASKGATNLIIESTNHFKRGDFCMIWGGDDSSIVNRVGYEDTAGAPAQRQIVKITAVGATNFTFWPPLMWDIPTNTYWPEARIYNYSASETNFTLGFGLENMRINPNGTDDTAIDFRTLAYSWISGVEISQPRNHCLYFRRDFGCQIFSNYFHDSTINGSGGGYGVTLETGSTANLIENNIAAGMTGSFQVNEGACGNVFAYNYVASSDYYQANWTQPDFQNHLAHPLMNLWEGNVGFMALFDDIHGSSSHHTLFRNRLFGYQNATIANQEFCIGVEAFSSSLNIVGNVLGESHMTTYLMHYLTNWNWGTKAIYAFDYDGLDRGDKTGFSTAIMHMNWDSVTATNSGVVWGTNADLTLDNSLYLSSKPAWFGSCPWPPIDPASPTTAVATNIPAGLRYANGLPPVSPTRTANAVTVHVGTMTQPAP